MYTYAHTHTHDIHTHTHTHIHASTRARRHATPYSVPRYAARYKYGTVHVWHKGTSPSEDADKWSLQQLVRIGDIKLSNCYFELLLIVANQPASEIEALRYS
jgi:hypothetical protein